MPHKFKRISEPQRMGILKCFAADLTATQTAAIVGLNRNTVNDWYRSLRERIAHHRPMNAYTARVLEENLKSKPPVLGMKSPERKGFLAFTRERLAKFNGISPKNLRLHLTETRFRYENRRNMLASLLKITSGSALGIGGS